MAQNTSKKNATTEKVTTKTVDAVKVEPITEEKKETAAPTKKTEEKKETAVSAKKTEEKKETVASEKKPEEKKETTAPVKKTTTRKPATKKASATKEASVEKEKKTTTKAIKVATAFYVEVLENQHLIDVKEYEEKVKSIWKDSWGKALKDLKSIDLYFKPEERKIYFVANGIDAGEFDL